MGSPEIRRIGGNRPFLFHLHSLIYKKDFITKLVLKHWGTATEIQTLVEIKIVYLYTNFHFFANTPFKGIKTMIGQITLTRFEPLKIALSRFLIKYQISVLIEE